MKKILVVDDEPGIREALTALLEDEGYQVVEASSGPQALELLPAERPDLVLLDIMMPLMDGHETYRQMDALTGIRKPPVIMVSAAVGPDSIDRRVSAFLRKPFDIDDLLAIIDRVLAAPD